MQTNGIFQRSGAPMRFARGTTWLTEGGPRIITVVLCALVLLSGSVSATRGQKELPSGSKTSPQQSSGQTRQAPSASVVPPTSRGTDQQLVAQRSTDLSFRFFQLLREHAPFPPPYAYLFILLILTVGVKIVALPLYLNTARMSVRLRKIQPIVNLIQSSDQPNEEKNRLLLETYKRHGVNVGAGCLTLLIDMVFGIWALVALIQFAPQLRLDGSRFFWITDVTRFDLWIVVVWASACWFQTMLTASMQSSGQQQAACGCLPMGAILIAMAWHWKWPASVFVFWLMLAVCGGIINSLLIRIMRAVDRS